MPLHGLLDPTTLLQTFGLFGVAAAVFAETGLLVGFFLAGTGLYRRPDGRLVTKAHLDLIHARMPMSFSASYPCIVQPVYACSRAGDCTSAFGPARPPSTGAKGHGVAVGAVCAAEGQVLSPVGLPSFLLAGISGWQPVGRTNGCLWGRHPAVPARSSTAGFRRSPNPRRVRDAAYADHQAAPAGGRWLAPAAGTGACTRPPRP
jgi:hypothetical protein